jgi:uncharacterized repeat protein (TIGR02543 family)
LNSNSTNYSTGITGVPSSDTVTRAFDGFYGNANGTGDDFIDETGVITAEGIAAATAAVAQGDDITWYANYKCAEPAHTGTPELRGYHFDGWYATAAATGDALSGTDWCLVDATNEVFAKWTAHTGTLTYACGTLPDPNPTQTIQGNGSSESVTYDHSVTLKDAATAGCSVQGYHFIGWKCNYDLATGEAYSDTTANYTYTSVGPAHTSGSFDNSNNIIAHYAVVAANGSDNANVTCTAMWEANTIGLTWTVGTGATANPTDAGGSSCTYDGDIDLPGTPTKPGYTFQGWSVTNPEPQTSEPTEPTGGQG